MFYVYVGNTLLIQISLISKQNLADEWLRINRVRSVFSFHLCHWPMWMINCYSRELVLNRDTSLLCSPSRLFNVTRVFRMRFCRFCGILQNFQQSIYWSFFLNNSLNSVTKTIFFLKWGLELTTSSASDIGGTIAPQHHQDTGNREDP